MPTERELYDTLTPLDPDGVTEFIGMCHRAKQTPLLIGEPGTGKTSLAYQYAARWSEELNAPVNVTSIGHNKDSCRVEVKCTTFIGSMHDSVDLTGIPIPDGDCTRWLRPEFLPRPGTYGVLVWDEVNRSPMSILNSMGQAILENRIGQHIIPDTWFQIGAMNAPGSIGTSRLPEHLWQRFFPVRMAVSLKSWRKWALDNQIHPVVLAFATWQESILKSCSPRNFEFLSNAVREAPSPRIAQAAFDAALHDHTSAVMFAGFLRFWDKIPNVDDCIARPLDAALPNMDHPSVIFALASALAQRADHRNLGRIIQYLSRLPDDYSVYAVLSAVKRDEVLTSTPEYRDWLVRFQEFL